MKPLVVYARDPGAANVTIAALAALGARPRANVARRLATLFGVAEATSPPALVFARGPAAEAWSRSGHPPLPPIDASAALSSACGLLTGLDDVDDPTPRALWRAARAANVPSAALCDNDANLGIRLLDASGRIWPDMLFALSERGRDEIVASGVPVDRVFVGENLHLSVFARRNDAADAARMRIRARWGVRPDRTVWLYAGVVRRELAHMRPTEPEDEIETLCRLIRYLDRHRSDVALIVRPHPRDPDGKYAVSFVPSVDARESRDGDSFAAIAGADVVVSLSPALIDEARLLGKKIVDPKELP